MSRRGNPFDNAKAESFIKTLKVEAVYNTRRLHSALGYLSSVPCQNRGLKLSTHRGALQKMCKLALPLTSVIRLSPNG